MQFTKMHGLSNDFVIINSITQKVHLSCEKIKQLSHRNCGIGFDQLLIIELSPNVSIDFHCRIYNADGLEVYQCGNGIRCVANFLYTKKITNKSHVKISTYNTVMNVSVMQDNFISVNMGEPVFEPCMIPFFSFNSKKIYILFIPNQPILCGVLSVGNPHCIIFVETVQSIPMIEWGSILEKHHCFPENANISFMQIIDSTNIKLRVYERGLGETQSCGSAACAAVAFGILQGLLQYNQKIQVILPGGSLFISWKGIGFPLYMTGPATHVYDGFINL